MGLSNNKNIRATNDASLFFKKSCDKGGILKQVIQNCYIVYNFMKTKRLSFSYSGSIFRGPIIRIVLFFFVIFYPTFVFLNPDIFPVLVHERVFHHKGSEINHGHADQSIHAFYRHASNSSKQAALNTPVKILLVYLFVLNMVYAFAKALPLVAVVFTCFILLFWQKTPELVLVNPRSRSPPSL